MFPYKLQKPFQFYQVRKFLFFPGILKYFQFQKQELSMTFRYSQIKLNNAIERVNKNRRR